MYQWCGFKSRRGKNNNLTALKSNSNTVWFNFQTNIYLIFFSEFIVTCSLIGLDEVIEIYRENLQFVEAFDTKLSVGKQHFLNIENSPSTRRDTLNICDKGWYPSIFVLLQEEFDDTKG